MTKKILVLQGHPNHQSFCASLAAAYERGALAAGHDVRRLDLSRMAFDPVLHQGYSAIQALEPDLVLAQQMMQEAKHLVVISPNWWGGMPANLKGFFDRTLLPGFGFKYVEGSPFPRKLLEGRTAHILTTMDTPVWYYRWVQGALGTKTLKHQILGFCGIKTTRTTFLAPIRSASASQRAKWLQSCERLGSGGR